MIFLKEENKLSNISPSNLQTITHEEQDIIYDFNGFELTIKNFDKDIEEYFNFLKSIEERYKIISEEEFEKEILDYFEKENEENEENEMNDLKILENRIKNYVENNYQISKELRKELKRRNLKIYKSVKKFFEEDDHDW